MKRMVFALLAMVLFAGTAMAGDTPPPNVIGLLPDPGFEINNGDWYFYGDATVTGIYPRTGLFSMIQGGDDAWGYAHAYFDLHGCDLDEPVWVFMGLAIFTPFPIECPGCDITEGWIANDQHVSQITLWQIYEYEMSDDGWVWPYIFMIDGLGDMLGDSLSGYLYIGSVTNDPGTDFLYDDVQIYCVPDILEYRLFLPVVMN